MDCTSVCEGGWAIQCCVYEGGRVYCTVCVWVGRCTLLCVKEGEWAVQFCMYLREGLLNIVYEQGRVGHIVLCVINGGVGLTVLFAYIK